MAKKKEAQQLHSNSLQSVSIEKDDHRSQIELQLHEQYATNSNAILGSMLTLFVAMLAVLAAYGYVFLRTPPSGVKNGTTFSLAELIYTATAAIFVLAAIAWFSIISGYRQRKEQFIINAIRKRYYTDEELNKIFPKGYVPYGKGIVEALQFPYDTFFWLSVITSLIIILSLILKCVSEIQSELVAPVFCLIITVVVGSFLIISKLLKSFQKYRECEKEYEEKRVL